MKTLLSLFCLTLLSAFTLHAGEKVADISHDDLKQAISDGKVTLLDVNGKESYSQGHIPGAVDYFASKDNLASVLPKEKDALIVAYCGNEHCGAYKKAADAAVSLGYTNVKHYSGGIAGWKAKNEPTDKS